jgi:sulfur carrier protein ThiS
MDRLNGLETMEISIQFIGFPIIYDLFPGGPHPYTLTGKTIAQLVDDLISRKGGRIQEALLDSRTKELDLTIQIAINGDFIPRDKIPQKEIQDGDHVIFFMLMAGG